MVALVLYSLLSWQVLPGITIEGAGSYFLIAFLAGFSERYFLRILDINVENGNGRTTEHVEKSASANLKSPLSTFDYESKGKSAKGSDNAG